MIQKKINEHQQGNQKWREWHNQESDDQQQREDKQKQDVESSEETQETTNMKTKEDDQEKSKNDITELEDEQKANRQQSQEQQELKMQGIANTTFNDETKDKQKEILNTNQTDTYQNLLKTSTNKETTEKDTQSKAQNRETQQQQDSPKEENSNDSNSEESLGSSIPKESSESKKSWKTQKTQSENEKERRKDESNGKASIYGYTWQLCNVTAGPDYIPCLDNEKELKKLHSTKHYEHRERHCPEEGPTCLVPLPGGYKSPISWPQSRDKVRWDPFDCYDFWRGL